MTWRDREDPMGGAIRPHGTEEEMAREDEAAIRELQARRTDLARPLPTVHRLRFASPDEADQARQQLEATGFTVRVRPERGAVVVESRKAVTIDVASVTQIRHTLQAIADATGGTYESRAVETPTRARRTPEVG
jgi:hypothetical protein